MTSLRRLWLLAAALLAVGSPAAIAAASEIVVDIEDEVMCLPCGRPLSSSGGTGADDQRAFIRRLADNGLSKQQIKDRLVEEYGERILVKDASPAAAVAPWLAALAGGLVLAGVWRRRGRARRGADDDGADTDASVPASPTPPARADDARIDAELSDTPQP